MLSIRIGDIAVGFCPCPPSPACPAVGVIVSGDMMNLSSGMPRARISDIVMFPCGPFIITTGDFNNLSSGMPIGMIGSQCVGAGTGTVVTGNPMEIG